MQQISKSEFSLLPLVLFVGIPVLGFLMFRHYGIFLVVLFITPVFKSFGQIFKTYLIKDGRFIIQNLFSTQKIDISSIREVHKARSTMFQQILTGMPDEFQIIRYNINDEIIITPKNKLIFIPSTDEIYFKN